MTCNLDSRKFRFRSSHIHISELLSAIFILERGEELGFDLIVVKDNVDFVYISKITSSFTFTFDLFSFHTLFHFHFRPLLLSQRFYFHFKTSLRHFHFHTTFTFTLVHLCKSFLAFTSL
jgi:hypothetical protein